MSIVTLIALHEVALYIVYFGTTWYCDVTTSWYAQGKVCVSLSLEEQCPILVLNVACTKYDDCVNVFGSRMPSPCSENSNTGTFLCAGIRHQILPFCSASSLKLGLKNVVV